MSGVSLLVAENQARNAIVRSAAPSYVVKFLQLNPVLHYFVVPLAVRYDIVPEED